MYRKGITGKRERITLLRVGAFGCNITDVSAMAVRQDICCGIYMAMGACLWNWCASYSQRRISYHPNDGGFRVICVYALFQGMEGMRNGYGISN